jgi:Protein of unknown function (DUF998)
MRWIEQFSALAGVASPAILFVPIFYVATQRANYSRVMQPISDLGSVGMQGAAIVNSGIVCAGLLAAASSLAVRNAFGVGSWSGAGTLALIVGGVALACTALSPWRGVPTDLSLLPNKVHLVAAIIGFLGISLTPILFGLQLRGSAGLFAIAVGALVLGLAFWPFQGDYRGLFQRLALGAFFLWLVWVCASQLFDEWARS